MSLTDRYPPDVSLNTDLYELTMAQIADVLMQRHALPVAEVPFNGGFAISCGTGQIADS